jgi:hypothetical protein
MALLKLENIATDVQGRSVDLELNEVAINDLGEGFVISPWQLVVRNTDGTIHRTVNATGQDAGEAYEAWKQSPAGQVIMQVIAFRANELLSDDQSAIRRELSNFATLTPTE